MKNHYRATFSDGTVTTRSTTSREYSHAWLMRYVCKNGPPVIEECRGKTYMLKGFAGSQELANKALGSALASKTIAEVLHSEVVAVTRG